MALTMPEAFIVDAVRTPVTRRGGGLAGDIARTAWPAAGGRYGLVTMCEGGGQANVTIIERL